jgi:acyl-CoA oxidase
MENARQTLGGHGFLRAAGLSDIYSTYVGVVTAEGENYLMAQQTAQYLLKSLSRAQSGKPLVGSCVYLERAPTLLQEQCRAFTASQLLDLSAGDQAPLVQAFRHRATRIVVEVALRMQQLLQSGEFGPEQAWNECLVDVYRMSRAHCLYVVIQCFVLSCTDAELSSSARAVLSDLCRLFGAAYIEEDLGDFLEDQYLSREQASLVHQCVQQQLKAVRPNALALCDAFGFTDNSLRSLLGPYDGNVYERLWQSVQSEPLNKQHQPPGYAEFVKPLLMNTVSKL